MKRKQEDKKERGITLIALVITIIVMLILVIVTINMAFNSKIFDKAGEAAKKTKLAMEDEESQIENAVKLMDQLTCEHQWGEWEEQEDGTQKRTCDKCGKEEIQEKPKGVEAGKRTDETLPK